MCFICICLDMIEQESFSVAPKIRNSNHSYQKQKRLPQKGADVQNAF